MAQKDFQTWHTVKSRIESFQKPPLFYPQEIWWCSLGLNIGIEQDGKNTLFQRPVLVFRKFHHEMLWALPMTSHTKTGIFYHPITFHGTERTILLSQIKTMSAKRLTRRLGKISDPQFTSVEAAFYRLIKQTSPDQGLSGA